MLLFWPVVLPFLTAVATLLLRDSPAARRMVSLGGAAALLAVGLLILGRVMTGGPIAAQAGGWPAPFGITFVADALSAALVALSGLVALAALVFAGAELSPEEETAGHHPLTHAMLAGVCGAFLTGDVFNMYVWFEVMLISSFGLLVVGGGKAQLDGAVKYVGLNLISTVAFLAGVGLLYGATGGLNMADLHVRLQGRGGETAILVAAAFLVFAFASKAALFPVFFWLPASYHTPSFATSALFAALLTKVGVYALIRVFTLVFDVEGTPIATVLLWGAVATMVVGGLGAIAQSTIRRTLGFGVVSSVGYMLLGLGLATPLAMMGSLLYLLQDVLTKAALFLGAGLTARVAGSEDFARAGGIWRTRPWIAVLFLIPALSLAGMPPFSGFWPKLALAQATIGTGAYWLALAVLGVGLLTLYAMARVWAAVYWSSHPAGDAGAEGPAPVAMVAPVAVLVALVALFGLWPQPLIETAQAAAATLLDPAPYLAAVAGAAP